MASLSPKFGSLKALVYTILEKAANKNQIQHPGYLNSF
jgi:hypothetical protein